MKILVDVALIEEIIDTIEDVACSEMHHPIVDERIDRTINVLKEILKSNPVENDGLNKDDLKYVWKKVGDV